MYFNDLWHRPLEEGLTTVTDTNGILACISQTTESRIFCSDYEMLRRICYVEISSVD